jgi:hypothetical protein
MRRTQLVSLVSRSLARASQELSLADLCAGPWRTLRSGAASCALAFAGVFACAPHALAQNDLAPHQIDEQIEYARGLASSWQFLDLSQAVLDGLLLAKLAPEQTEALALARSEVFASGARTIADDSQREALFDQALDGYRAFLDSYPNSGLLAKARRDYITVAADYATHMANLIADATGDEAKRLGAAVESRLTAVLSDSGAAIQSLGDIAERTESQDRQFWSMRLDRGRLLLRLGRATSDGQSYLRLAEEEMSTVAFEAPSDSSYPLQAFLVLGEVYLALGQARDAADTFAYVAEESIPISKESWTDLKQYLDQPQIAFRWLYLESVTPMLMDAYLATGRTAMAADAGLHLFNCVNGDRLTFSPNGQLAAVATARTLFEAGGWVGGSVSSADYRWFQTVEDAEAAGFTTRTLRSALEFALTVALDMSKSASGLAQTRAKALISDLIESPGITFGPDVLFEAARGSFEARDYQVAASAFRRVSEAVAGNEADARVWGGKIAWYLGECFRRQNRDLEAAMAFHHGITRWRGDAEYDAKNVQAGYAAIGRALKADPEAKALVEIRDELGAILRSMPEAGRDVAWDFAKRKFDEALGQTDEERARRAFAEAVELFGEVPTDSPNYATARARIGVSHYLARDPARAAAAFDAFESERAGVTDAALRGRFEVALRDVRFYQGQLALDAKDFRRAFEIFAEYPAQFPDERTRHDQALAFAVEAAVALGDIDSALVIMRRLAKDFPDSSQTLRSAGAVFSPLYAVYKDSESGSDERGAILPELAEAVGLRNRLTLKPTFDLLALEADVLMESGRYEDALAVLERIVTAYDGDTSEKIQTRLRQQVKPDRGIALINLKRLPEAHAVLAPLVPAPDDSAARRPSLAVIESYVKSVVGWPAGDPARPEVLPGVGGAPEIQKAYEWAVKLSTAAEREEGKWTESWLEARFLELWALYQWGKLDSKQMDALKGVLTSFKGELGSEFKAITDTVGAAPALAARYLWLDRLPK